MREFVLSIVLLGAAVASAPAATRGTLSAGAAKVDITPPADAALPMSGYAGRQHGFDGIHDHIYARAIVLHDGTNYGAIVTWELIGVPNQVWAETSERIAKETGIPVQNLMFAGVHDHSAPSPARMYGNNPPDPKSVAYTAKAEDAVVEAVRQAKSRLQPARVGAGTGKAYVNMNRREYAGPGEMLRLGFNPEGPSDKTVAVVRFETLTGKPIALLINYAVHAVVMGPANFQVTGDLAGATSRFVEEFYRNPRPRSDAGPALRPRPQEVVGEDGMVAIWTSGPAGDQNPVSVEPASDFTLVNALGKILGEEAVRVSGAIKTSPTARIFGAQEVVTCPGRRFDPASAKTREYKFSDADPVSIRIGLLRINDIALAGVSGEVLTRIYWHLKQDSPVSQTFMVTHANGSSGYIPDEASYGQMSYEITTSRLKPGCAEEAIVNGFLRLMEQY